MDSDFKLLVGTKVEDNIQSQLDKFPKRTIVITPILDKEGLQIGTREISNYISKTGDMVQVTKEFNKDGTEMSKTLTKVGETTKGVSKNISETSKHTSDLGGKFLDITKKVVAFGAVTAIIGAFTKSMSDAIEVTKEFDGSLAELRKVSDLSGEGLQEYTEDSFKMARELSTTASTVTDAVALFVQAGYDLEQAKGLAKYSIMLQAIADHSMDTETATNFLTSTIKAFNMTAEDSEKIINSVNETSNKYAITSNDLTENLGKVAGVAGTAGVEFEQLLGLMVSSVEKTRNASKSANAFKSIFVNLQQMDSTGTVPKLSKQFDDFGISMTNTNGSMKDAYELLRELSVAYEDAMSGGDVNKQNKMRTLLEDIGG